MSRARIYMDWNATAPLLDEARAAILSALDCPGNPSSVHAEGRRARQMVEAARRSVASLCGTLPAHVTFTSGATEAANQVLTPDFRMGRTPLAIGRLYVSAVEHPAVMAGGRFSPDRITVLPVNGDGVIDLGQLDEALQAHDATSGLPMVAVMLANNESGVIQPVAEVAGSVRRAGGVLVVDAVQAAGRLALSIEALGADFLILSAHKLGGPKGVGALVSRGEMLMPAPLMRGGGQEKGHRSGTENPAGVAGFGAAADVATRDLEPRMAQVTALRDRLESGMRAAVPGLVIHGAAAARIGNTSLVTIPGLKSETLQIALDLEGIAVSSGSACASGKVGRSPVLDAMGVKGEEGALRLSLGPQTNEDEVERVVAAIGRIAARKREAGVAA
ncbi:cysteine desulfurase [Rhizobium rhizosphaerae]|uniref:Cysteine desulfurase n=1 Tax=Xaviernesmea rhizosphaerae TaxID=1672749 RepID=A0ABX3PJJ9_9HYPH|nr:cysteine desulfurase family protein [Xaviernesmea rhizosphaerae]OQP88233.1 cysteine desulfurase [Xaviernesmea rhizosphaerae]